MTWHENIMVNLIRDDLYLMTATDAQHSTQFIFCPDTTNRIMWGAEQKYFYIFPCDFLFQIFQIRRIHTILFA